MPDTTDLGELPKARVFCAGGKWYYSIEREVPIGPFLSDIEAGRACRGELIALAERGKQ